MIKYDPSQTKAVVILLVVLAIAIAATVMRINPSDPPAQAAASSAGTAPERSSASVTIQRQAAIDRNPFARPVSVVENRSDESMQIGYGEPLDKPERLNSLASRGAVSIQPLAIRAVPSVPQDENTSKLTGGEITAQTKPSFTLLATVKSGDGLCAVIKSGESDTKVVELGDFLEGGFKVVELNADRAVLTDGRETIIAKRLQSK